MAPFVARGSYVPRRFKLEEIPDGPEVHEMCKQKHLEEVQVHLHVRVREVRQWRGPQVQQRRLVHPPGEVVVHHLGRAV